MRAPRGREVRSVRPMKLPFRSRPHGLSRGDFMFTIGYRGSVAIVDRAARRRYARLPCPQLLERGLYKAALCAAEFDGDAQAQQAVLASYNADAVAPLPDVDELRARFGVFGVPDAVTGVERV